jgi:hypothetical protein
MTFIRKAEIPVFSDDNVFVDRYAHDIAAKNQFPGDRHVIGGRRGVSGWMIMGKNHRRGMMV